MKMPTVGSLLLGFFEDYLKSQKGLSPRFGEKLP